MLRLRVDMHRIGVDVEVAQDARPEVNVQSVVVGAEAKTADHLEKRQVGAVTDFIDVVGADAILDVAVAGAIGRLESGFEGLHPGAVEKRRGVIGDDVGGEFEGETEFAVSTAKGLD